MSEITRSAADELCTVRIPGVCATFNCVLAHYRLSGTCGGASKPPDMQAAYCCTPCHDVCDGRARSNHERDFVRLCHAEGVMRTQLILQRKGLIVTADDARPPKRSI